VAIGGFSTVEFFVIILSADLINSKDSLVKFCQILKSEILLNLTVFKVIEFTFAFVKN